MDMPDISSELTDRELLQRADEKAERLLAELKQKVRVEAADVGTLRKSLTVTVPAEVIESHLQENLDELRSDALIPGFRKGRAPIQLVQKRYGSEVRESLKTSILGQSLLAAVENQGLEVLGDPLFRVATADGEKLMELDEALPHISLPASGDFTYHCELEIKPTFELPELKGIEVKTPTITITDDDVTAELTRLCKIRGRLEPLTTGGAEPDDQIIAAVRLVVEDKIIKQEDNVELAARPARLDGIVLEELGEALKGAKPGDELSIDCQIPEDYERTDLRGKSGRFEFTVHEVKRLKPLAVGALAEQYGVESEAELRELIRDNLEAQRDRLIELGKKEQICNYLLEHVPLELPEKLSARQTERAVLRKVIDLQQRGVPQAEIAARIDELRTTASAEVARSLKLEFILEKVAEQLAVEVTDEEINTEIARIARLYNQRFDRVRDSLHARGLLGQLTEQLRQDKCLALLMAQAQVTQMPPAESEG